MRALLIAATLLAGCEDDGPKFVDEGSAEKRRRFIADWPFDDEKLRWNATGPVFATHGASDEILVVLHDGCDRCELREVERDWLSWLNQVGFRAIRCKASGLEIRAPGNADGVNPWCPGTSSVRCSEREAELTKLSRVECDAEFRDTMADMQRRLDTVAAELERATTAEERTAASAKLSVLRKERDALKARIDAAEGR